MNLTVVRSESPSTLEVAAATSAFLRHCVLDQTDDSHEDGSTNTAAGNVADDGAQIQRAAASRSTSHYALEKRAAQAAADNSRDGVPCCAQAVLFHCRAGDVAADCATDCFNDQTDYVHRFEF